jgi:hypothetical protein
MKQFTNRRQTAQVFAIFFCLAALSGSIQAQGTSGVSYSLCSITKSMDLAVRSYSTSYLYTTPASQTDSAKKVSAQSDSLGVRSPNKALLFAVFPGFIAHGSGHFYARKPLTGLVLLATEAGGIMLWRQGGNFMGASHGGTDGELSQFLIGMGLFFGSWAYDLICAPHAINKENEKLMGIPY